MPKSKKDPFEQLDEEWKNEVQAESVDDINNRIAELAKAEEANKAAQSEDEDLLEKKDAARQASAPYRDATKGFRLRMRFIMSVLEARGKS